MEQVREHRGFDRPDAGCCRLGVARPTRAHRRGRLAPVLAGCILAAAIIPGASAEVLIRIDKASQRMSVTVDGQPRHDWPVSTGASGYDTPSGTYQPSRLSRHHFSREWDNAPMPFAIFFTAEGHAIHGTQQSRLLGRPASHGCVRLAPRNAGLLFALVRAEGLAKTQVVVDGDDGPMAGGGSAGPGVNPLAVLQQSAAARARWRSEAIVSAPIPAAAPAAKLTEATNAGSAASAPAAAGASAATQAPIPVVDREGLMGQLLSRGAQVAKPICSAC